jgi:hypothetical protein
MKHPLLITIGATVATFALTATAYACSCMMSTPAEHYARADVVFSGTVDMVALPRSSDGNGTSVFFIKINRLWKGSVGSEVTVTSPESSATCGINLEKGKEYVIFAMKGETNLTTTLCSGTALYSQSAETLAYLNNRGTNSCEPIVCSDGREFASCDANGEQLMWTGGTPCFNEADPENSCPMGICPDGYRYPTCSEDGHPINYFADPCLTHQSSAFSDVRPGHPQYDAVLFAKAHNIVQGYGDGTFRPSRNIVRAEFVKMLVASLYARSEIDSCLSGSTRLPYDVPRGEWFAPYVCVALKHEVVAGYPDGSFRPGANINAAESAKIFVRTTGMETDTASTGEQWYAPYIDSLASENALPSSYRMPSQLLTRGEMAEILWNMRVRIQPMLQQ